MLAPFQSCDKPANILRTVARITTDAVRLFLPQFEKWLQPLRRYLVVHFELLYVEFVVHGSVNGNVLGVVVGGSIEAQPGAEMGTDPLFLASLRRTPITSTRIKEISVFL